jgi:hypothetical protein
MMIHSTAGIDNINRLISIAIITSPSPHHPDTSMVWQVIDSIKFLRGLENCSLQVICDGFSVRDAEKIRGNNPWSMSKIGVIVPEAATLYEQYCNLLEKELDDLSRSQCTRSLSILRLSTHHGFAFAVQEALTRANTPYVLILQHDRAFVKYFDFMPSLMQAFEDDPAIRYIGFPTVTSSKHDEHQRSQYHVRDALLPLCRSLVPASSKEVECESGKLDIKKYQLVPLLFWYDSNHLAHVKRYLEIYRPFKNAPAELRSVIGSRGLKDMLLRRGDFIEDRVGQVIIEMISRYRVHL